MKSVKNSHLDARQCRDQVKVPKQKARPPTKATEPTLNKTFTYAELSSFLEERAALPAIPVLRIALILMLEHIDRLGVLAVMASKNAVEETVVALINMVLHKIAVPRERKLRSYRVLLGEILNFAVHDAIPLRGFALVNEVTDEDRVFAVEKANFPALTYWLPVRGKMIFSVFVLSGFHLRAPFLFNNQEPSRTKHSLG